MRIARWFAFGLLASSCGVDAPTPSRPVAPTQTPVVEAPDLGPEPRPIAGGTLLVSRDDTLAIVADPDLDRVVIVDLASRSIAATLPLTRGDEPGRAVEDGDRRVHLSLRGAGALATIDLTTRTITERRAVCDAPRGVAWDADRDLLHVACAGGELVTIAPGGGAPTRTVMLDRDLRDVVVQGNRIFVTRFRTAETLVLDASGQRLEPIAPTQLSVGAGVAWRMTPAVGGGAWLLHTRAVPVAPVTAGGYNRGGSGCGDRAGIARPGITLLRPPLTPVVVGDVPNAPLAVDLAVAPGGQRAALAVPGNVASSTRATVVELTALTPSSCAPVRTVDLAAGSQAIAVAYTRDGVLLAQTRAPSTLFIEGASAPVQLGGEAVRNRGHQLFHTNATGLVACASCHPEGDDDGRTWTFQPLGPRRTQPIRGGIAATAPFHWDGDLTTFTHLVSEVLVRRMGASSPSISEGAALLGWIDHLPVRARPANLPQERVARGEALFRAPDVGCAGCHSGPMLTNNLSFDVGTGGSFQVPTLRGIAWRPPYMHNGCAPTLRDRFTAPCGGGDRHGRTSQLTVDQIDDLVAYMETL